MKRLHADDDSMLAVTLAASLRGGGFGVGVPAKGAGAKWPTARGAANAIA